MVGVCRFLWTSEDAVIAADDGVGGALAGGGVEGDAGGVMVSGLII